jgi:uncharacterized protein RhaS with RHS repeats
MAETGVNQNYNRDYDPAVGRYVEAYLVGLKGGVKTYAYVGNGPISFFDSDGLGKQGGQSSVGGDDPAIPEGINQNSSPEEIAKAIQNAEAELQKPGINPKRAAKIRGWIKVAKRGFTRGACPPLLEELALATAGQLCAAGDLNMCEVYRMLGGEIGVPGT